MDSHETPLKQSVDPPGSAAGGLFEAPEQSFDDATERIWCFEIDPPLPTDLDENELASAILQCGRLTACNPSYARRCGCEHVHEVIGLRLADVMSGSHGGRPEIITQFIRSGFQLTGLVTTESPEAADQGAVRRPRIVLNSIAGIVTNGCLQGGWGVQRDATQRQVEQPLIAARCDSEERYQALFESSRDLVYVHDFEGRFLDANPAALAALGYDRDEIRGLGFGDLLDPAKLRQTAETLEELRRTGSQSEVTEYRVRCKDGKWLHLETKSSVIFSQGKPHAVQGIARDVTERTLAEARLADLVAVVEQVADDIVVTDLEGRVRYVNPAFERTTGYVLAEATGRDITTLLGGNPDDPAHREKWETVRAGGVWQGRFENRTRDGRLILQDASVSPIWDASGRISGYVSARRDVTQRVEMEERAAQAQKLEAIGTLAGGIAHDLNNILSAILGYTELALSKCSTDPAGRGAATIREDLQAVMQGSRRASDLIRQILTFSREDRREERLVQIGPVVHEALTFMRATIPATIEMIEHIDSDSSALADPSEIHQVMVNLCTNAATAMRERGGALEVRLIDVELDAARAAQHLDLTSGRFLCLTVRDNGCGMTPAVMTRIFEPFFTTRDKGLGTGLGLAVVHGIVKRAGGAISVASESGKGTTFEVYLPVLAGRAADNDPLRERPAAGIERVFFVDDEIMLGRLAIQALGRSGYRVTPFPNGMEALAAFEADPWAVDLVVTDMTMPIMTGDELTRRLRRIRPDLPIILCTGFSERIDADAAKAMGIDEFVMKPVLMSELAKIIRGVLDRK